MRRTIVVALLVALAATGCRTRTTAPQDLPPCPTEDSGRNCFWDAEHRGNGQGRSFWVDGDGIPHYLDHGLEIR